VTLAREVEQHRITITNILKAIRRWPLSFGVASDAVTAFHLEQGDSWPLIITPRVKVVLPPSVFWASVQHVCDESLIAEQLLQVFLLFLLSGAFWISQKFVDDRGKDLIVSGFWFRYCNNGCRLGLNLRNWLNSYSLRASIRRFNLRDWIRLLGLRNLLLDSRFILCLNF
jgi:hypothetical protein